MTYETVKGLHFAAALRRLQVGVDDDAEESLLPGPGASGRSGYTEFGAVITGSRAGAYQDIGGSWDQIWSLGALRGPLGPQKGHFRAKTVSFRAPRGPEGARYQVKVCGEHDSNP